MKHLNFFKKPEQAARIARVVAACFHFSDYLPLARNVPLPSSDVLLGLPEMIIQYCAVH